MFPNVSDRFRPFPFFWTINWTNSVYGRLIQCKPMQTMTLKLFRATLVRIDCTKYCILALISNIFQKSQELVKFNRTSIGSNWGNQHVFVCVYAGLANPKRLHVLAVPCACNVAQASAGCSCHSAAAVLWSNFLGAKLRTREVNKCKTVQWSCDKAIKFNERNSGSQWFPKASSLLAVSSEFDRKHMGKLYTVFDQIRMGACVYHNWLGCSSRRMVHCITIMSRLSVNLSAVPCGICIEFVSCIHFWKLLLRSGPHGFWCF